jgi:hypothetical protein
MENKPEINLNNRQKNVEIVGGIAAALIIVSLFISGLSLLIVPMVIVLILIFVYSLYKNKNASKQIISYSTQTPESFSNNTIPGNSAPKKAKNIAMIIAIVVLGVLGFAIVMPFIGLMFIILMLGVSGV